MTLKYHRSPNGTLTRCVASTADACPFGGEAKHYDRTDIAEDSGGIIVQKEKTKQNETLVTPMLAKTYAVYGDDGKVRTYTSDGKLIPFNKRQKYLADNPDLEALVKAFSGKVAPVHSSPAGGGKPTSARENRKEQVRRRKTRRARTRKTLKKFLKSGRKASKSIGMATDKLLASSGTIAAGGSASGGSGGDTEGIFGWLFDLFDFSDLKA